MTIFERRRLVVGLVVFAILVLLALAFGIPKIQDDQVAAVERQLQAKGITGVDVSFSGRDGTLSGPAALADPALAAVTDRNGMRSLDYDATDLVEEPATTVPGGATTVPGAATTSPAAASSTVPAALQATANIDGKTVTLGGAVTSDAEKKAVTDAATAAFGPGRVADQLTVTGSPRDPGTAAAFTGFTQLLGASGAAVRSGGLQMSGNVVNFAGTAFSPQAATAFNQALQQLSTTGVSATGSAQPPTQLDAPGLQLSMNDLFGRAGITFASGSAAIDPRSRPTLDTAAQVILAGPTATIEVGGHTDNQGAAATNQRLSLQRAQAVRAYLISKGVPAARLVAKGYGSTKPLVDNATPEGRAQNRRIELTVLGGLTMLYVAGEILVWMALAFLLGVAVGWFVWGIRSRRAAPAAAVTSAAAASSEVESVTVRPVMKPMAAVSDTAEQVPVTPPAGQPAVVVLPAERSSASAPASDPAPAAASAEPAGSAGSVADAADVVDDVDETSTVRIVTPPVADDEPVIAMEDLEGETPTTVADASTDHDALADLVASELAGDPAPTPAAGQPVVAPVDVPPPAAEPATSRGGATSGGAPTSDASSGAASSGSAGSSSSSGSGAGLASAADRSPEDLQVVEGIGPRIEVILKDAGIGTWQDLAESSPERLRTLLDLAGDQYRVHDPASWPQQAELAAAGRWPELQDLQATLHSE